MKPAAISAATLVLIALLGIPTFGAPQISQLNNLEYDSRLNNGKLSYWNRGLFGTSGLSNTYIKPPSGMNNLGFSQDLTEPNEQPKAKVPYQFIFQSKDQTRYEVSDEKGNIRGSFTFVDKQYGVPKTVNYEAGVVGVSKQMDSDSPSFVGNGTPLPSSPEDQLLSSRKAELVQWSKQIASLPEKLPVNLGQYQPPLPFNSDCQNQLRIDQPINSGQLPLNGGFSPNVLQQTSVGLTSNPTSQFFPGKPTVVLLPPIPVLPLLPKGTPECRNEAGEFAVSERCMQASRIPPLSPQLATLVSPDRANGQIPFVGSTLPFGPSPPIRPPFDKFPFGPYDFTNGDSFGATNAAGNVLANEERASYSVMSPDGLMRVVGFNELPVGNGAPQTLIGNSLSDVSNTIESPPNTNSARIVSSRQIPAYANTFTPAGAVSFPFMFISPETMGNAQNNAAAREKTKEIVENSTESKENADVIVEEDNKKEATSAALQGADDKSPDSDYEVLAAIAEKIAKLAKSRNSEAAKDSSNEISK